MAALLKQIAGFLPQILPNNAPDLRRTLFDRALQTSEDGWTAMLSLFDRMLRLLAKDVMIVIEGLDLFDFDAPRQGTVPHVLGMKVSFVEKFSDSSTPIHGTHR